MSEHFNRPFPCIARGHPIKDFGKIKGSNILKEVQQQLQAHTKLSSIKGHMITSKILIVLTGAGIFPGRERTFRSTRKEGTSSPRISFTDRMGGPSSSEFRKLKGLTGGFALSRVASGFGLSSRRPSRSS